MFALSRPFITTLLLAGVSIIGCGGNDNNPDARPASDAPPSPKCLEANDHSDLTWIQDNIFTPSCANFSACHKGDARDAGGLNLEVGKARQNMIDVDSKLFAQFKLIKPSAPAQSYLMIILGHVDGPIDQKAGTMPYNSPKLCIEKRNAVERWIAAGAQP